MCESGKVISMQFSGILELFQLKMYTFYFSFVQIQSKLKIDANVAYALFALNHSNLLGFFLFFLLI